MLEELKKKVYEANMLLPKYNLVTFTWGNVSEIDPETGYFAIKPSGVEYDELTPDDMVIMDLDGNKIEGKYNPSSDTATHIEIYKGMPDVKGIVHTHSPWATSWAQAGRGIPCYGTTHADSMYGEIPCVRNLTKEEIEEAYEKNTGVLIVDHFKDTEYMAMPAVLWIFPAVRIALSPRFRRHRACGWSWRRRGKRLLPRWRSTGKWARPL